MKLPEDPVLRGIAEQLEAQRWIAEVWDADRRLVYLTSDYVLSAGAGSDLGDVGLGLPVDSEEALAIRDAWPAGATTESFRAALETYKASSAPVVFTRVDVKFGTATRPFHSIGIRLPGGSVSLVVPALPGAIQSLLGTGDLATLERTLALLRPGRRPGAILFVDLEGSSALARTLPTATYFALIRRLIFRIDEEVVARGGVVGKHAGDGASAFFLAEQIGGEEAAATACVEAMRAIRGVVPEVAERSGVDALSVRFGLHWGSAIYVGRLLTGGRTEVTALGEEVNEAARIEACAGGGLALASKALVERVPALASADLRYTALADVPGASEKAARDAPSIPVCEL